MIKSSKQYAIARVVDPDQVEARCRQFQGTYHPGAIFVNCPELGFENEHLLYCRYGLSIPYIKVAAETPLWIEPTIGNDERWIYTGFAEACPFDRGKVNQLVVPIEEDGYCAFKLGADVMAEVDSVKKSWKVTIGSISVSIDGQNGIIKLCSENASEHFVLGDTLKRELQKDTDALTDLQTAFKTWAVRPQDGGAALKAAAAGFIARPMADYSRILSSKVMGE